MNTKVIYYENNKKSCYWRISLYSNIFVLFSSITLLYDYKNLVLGTWSIESDKKIYTFHAWSTLHVNNACNVDLIDRYIPCRMPFSVFECARRFVGNVNCPSDDSTVNCLFLGDLSSYRGLPTPHSLETRASTVTLTLVIYRIIALHQKANTVSKRSRYYFVFYLFVVGLFIYGDYYHDIIIYGDSRVNFGVCLAHQRNE